MKKQKHVEKQSSVRLGIFFVCIVTITIGIALVYRTFQMYQRSIYESDQPFTIHITAKESTQEIVGFNPVDKKITRFSIKNLPSDQSLSKTAGIPADAKVFTSSLSLSDSVSQQLKTLFFRLPDAKTTLTLIDLLRLYTLSQTIPSADIEEIQVDSIDSIPKVEKLLEEHFLDTVMRDDNKTVQIINASGISGMGGRVEKTINRLGAAVIDVNTARKEEAKTSIQYTGEETYTITKMRKLFSVPVAKVEGERISDIIIVLGKDKPHLID